MIRTENLHKQFGKNKVLRGIDLDLNHRGITAILGPNGSGKTTLIKTFLGMVIPDQGHIFIDDTDIKGQFEYRQKIAHLPQVARFPENLVAREIISMIKDLRPGQVNEDKLIKMFGLESELDKKMGNLSGGTRQKVNLLLTFMYDSPLIILDEPTTGLDPIALINLKQLLKEEQEKGKQILITTHIMSFVEEVAEHIVFILDGKIYFNGKLTALLALEKEEKLENAIAHILKPHLN